MKNINVFEVTCVLAFLLKHITDVYIIYMFTLENSKIMHMSVIDCDICHLSAFKQTPVFITIHVDWCLQARSDATTTHFKFYILQTLLKD